MQEIENALVGRHKVTMQDTKNARIGFNNGLGVNISFSRKMETLIKFYWERHDYTLPLSIHQLKP
jgi:hypothetical protein